MLLRQMNSSGLFPVYWQDSEWILWRNYKGRNRTLAFLSLKSKSPILKILKEFLEVQKADSPCLLFRAILARNVTGPLLVCVGSPIEKPLVALAYLVVAV